MRTYETAISTPTAQRLLKATASKRREAVCCSQRRAFGHKRTKKGQQGATAQHAEVAPKANDVPKPSRTICGGYAVRESAARPTLSLTRMPSKDKVLAKKSGLGCLPPLRFGKPTTTLPTNFTTPSLKQQAKSSKASSSVMAQRRGIGGGAGWSPCAARVASTCSAKATPAKAVVP